VPSNGGLVAAFALIQNELGVQEAKHKCNILDFYENQKYELFKIFPVIM